MFRKSHGGFDIFFDVYVVNQAFGRSPEIPDIYGFRGVVVPSGLPEGDRSGTPFKNEPQEGYRQADLANAMAMEVGTRLADCLANQAR